MAAFSSKVIFNPSSSAQLRQALLEARGGDVINLSPRAYCGPFTLNGNQIQNQQPIFIQGSKGTDSQCFTTIVGDNWGLRTAITILGGKWVLSGIVIRSTNHLDLPQIGIKVQGDGHILRDIVLKLNQTRSRVVPNPPPDNNINDRFAIILQGNDNRLENVNISRCFKGILIQGSRNSLKNVTLSRIKDEGIVVRTGSTGTEFQTISVSMKENKPLLDVDIPEPEDVENGQMGQEEVDQVDEGGNFNQENVIDQIIDQNIANNDAADLDGGGDLPPGFIDDLFFGDDAFFVVAPLPVLLRVLKRNDGKSLVLENGSTGTSIVSATFQNGISNIYGTGGVFKGCKFAGVNLFGEGNEFSESSFTKFHVVDQGNENNRIQDSCKIRERVDDLVKFG